MKMNKKLLLLCSGMLGTAGVFAQTNPAITSWLINTTGIVGRHYVSGNSTPFTDTYPANVQTVQYSAANAYIKSSGIPSYIVGPYLDGNPSLASNNNHIFKIPLTPVQNTGTPVATSLGSIGVFINGVPMYNGKDAFSYKASTGTNVQMGDGVWNRDAIVAERTGFDCAKGHPSPIFSGGPGGPPTGGTYHHHQNPTAFNLDIVTVSNVCDLYLADGLYTINASTHSPLIGYAFDGFPVYGAYGYANADGTGGIARIRSSYKLRSITARTHYADGTDVADGPAVSASFPLGMYMEDYEYVAGYGDLDEHNGRFCKTPEYPAGIYCYFATVDANWNSAYPYLIGPAYYGVNSGGKITSITETVTDYHPTTGIATAQNMPEITIFPNPAGDIVAIQAGKVVKSEVSINMFDITGRLIYTTRINAGSTIAYIDARTLYNGDYLLQITADGTTQTKKVTITK